MKFNILRYLFSAAVSAFLLCACDNVDIADRFIETDPVVPARAVLLEDFTGQNCLNCPDAHERITALVEQYGDNIIPVSVHAGGLAISVDRTNFEYNYVGLMTPEGSEYDTRYNSFQSWPAGTVNRGSTLSHTGWAAAVRAALEEEADIAIELSAITDGSQILTEVTLRPSANLKGRLQLWVLEDGIVARQKLPDSSYDQEYVHNHVLRAAINGIWGEEMSLTSGIHSTLNHSIPLRDTDKERWNPDNLSVVAFFYNDSGVLQATRAKVTRDS